MYLYMYKYISTLIDLIGLKKIINAQYLTTDYSLLNLFELRVKQRV